MFPASHGIAVSGSDVYWANPAAGSVQRRVADKSIETLLSDNDQHLDQIVLGTQRLFVRNSRFLYVESTKLDGSDVRTDEQVVYTMRFRSGRLYYATTGGNELGIFSQDEVNVDDATQDFNIEFQDGPNLGDFAFHGSKPVYGIDFYVGAGSYDIGKPTGATGPGSSIFGSKAGRLYQLECDSADGYYWRRTTSSGGLADLVMQHEGETHETAITANVDVTDFALSESATGTVLIYYAFTDPAAESSGLRLYDTSSGETHDVVAGDRVGSLLPTATYLYFFEENGQRLVRTPLPELTLGLGQ